jgi:hemoglobin-like flavoprotein
MPAVIPMKSAPTTQSAKEVHMDARQIAIVQESFEKVRPIAAVAADLFYGKLFELDPQLKSLFRGDMKEQGRMLMSVIASAVRSLSAPAPLVPALKDMGKRHVAYGVREHHYATVGTALLWTLEQGLGDDFTPELRAAWTATYTLLAGVMQEGAREFHLAQAA